ncbi:hypothetical protein EVJ58_g11144 [Rhodofomes roseus]|uniref:Uncharacterized protein n=1 Tax=Rhodofomes roseus TaxID=34475 RepID=A0A4Y9XLG5_9APHY|nr:hypothetical protein EVJ58_g11144 [Rhodofomes roseus]
MPAAAATSASEAESAPKPQPEGQEEDGRGRRTHTEEAAGKQKEDTKLKRRVTGVPAADEDLDVKSIRHRLDAAGRLPQALRRPESAKNILEALMLPDPSGRFASVFDEAHAIINADWSDKFANDQGTIAANAERRYALRAEVTNRILYVSLGMELAVNDMLSLEETWKEWKVDPTGELMYHAYGCKTGSILLDLFHTLRQRISKAVDMLHYRMMLHAGNAPVATAPSSSASDFYELASPQHSARHITDLYLARQSVAREERGSTPSRSAPYLYPP